MPDPPAWLDEAARVEWDRIVPLLETGSVIHSVDLAVIAAYCSTFSLWAELRQTLTAANVVGDDGKLNPAARYAESLLKQLRGLLDQLGFTPAARRQILTSQAVSLEDILNGSDDDECASMGMGGGESGDDRRRRESVSRPADLR